MKIICVGWNYANHNEEMDRVAPSEPSIFMKPDSALLRENRPFFLPRFSDRIEYEAELVVKINRLGKNISEKFAPRYYDEVTLGIDFTARDLQEQQKNCGGPWEICKAFDHSAVMGNFVKLDSLQNPNAIEFQLLKNGNQVQKGNSADMLFNVNQIIAYVSKFFTLKIGDVIFTGTPAGVGPVAINDRLEGYLEEEKMFDFMIK